MPPLPKDLSDKPPPCFDSHVRSTGKCFYCGLTSVAFAAFLCTRPPQWASSVPEPAASCVVKVMVAPLICGALGVRSRLRLSPQHWADLSSLQPHIALRLQPFSTLNMPFQIIFFFSNNKISRYFQHCNISAIFVICFVAFLCAFVSFHTRFQFDINVVLLNLVRGCWSERGVGKNQK